MTQRERDTIIHLVAGGWVNLKKNETQNKPELRWGLSIWTHIQLTSFRFAGTVGAIVTCPLEVVKTRLQSSSSQFYPPNIRENVSKQNGSSQMKGLGGQRDLCSSILRKRPQVIPFPVLGAAFALRSRNSVLPSTDSNYFTLRNSVLLQVG